jgi:3'-phosphoadenosine 5'-phosphosulfate sulfotransferase (PAPS reductase)/FAD synthetase
MESANKKQLFSLLNLPLEEKVKASKEFIRDWYEKNEGMIFVCFSGGKDSTALLHLCRQVYKDIPAVYLDTGIEYPEIDDFAKSTENVVCLKPDMSYEEVTGLYGYSVLSRKISEAVEAYQDSNKKESDLTELKNKVGASYLYLKDIPCKVSNKCCNVLKEEPLDRYITQSNRKPIVGILAEESMGRMRRFMTNGINQYNNSVSYPIAFWSEADVKRYLKEENIPYCSIYGDLETYGEKRTICMYCLRGVHLEERPNRFERMKECHSDKYKYFMNALGMSEAYNFLINKGV